MSAALPPLPTPEAAHWEANQWGHAELTASDAYTADQMQAYAQQARDDLESENAMLREALEKITHYAECQVAAFSSGRPSLDMTLFPHLCANARAALKEQP